MSCSGLGVRNSALLKLHAKLCRRRSPKQCVSKDTRSPALLHPVCDSSGDLILLILLTLLNALSEHQGKLGLTRLKATEEARWIAALPA